MDSKTLCKDDVPFCMPENIQQCIKFLSEEFVALGFPSGHQAGLSTHTFSIRFDLVNFLNNVYEMLQVHYDDEKIWKEHQTRNISLMSELQDSRSTYSQLCNVLSRANKKLDIYVEKDKELQRRVKDLQTDLKIVKDEVKKATSALHQKQTLFSHEIKKRECENLQLRAKINQLMLHKYQGNMNILNPPTNLESQRKQWNSSNVVNSNLEKMYQAILFNYETRCCGISQDFSSLCEFMKSTEEEVSVLTKELQDLVTLSSDDIKGIDPTEESPAKHVFHTSEFRSYELTMESLKGHLELMKAAVRELNVKEFKKKDQASENEDYEVINKGNSEDNMDPRKAENEGKKYLRKQLESVMKGIETERKSVEILAAQIKKEKEELDNSKLEFLHLQISASLNCNTPLTLSYEPSLPVVTNKNGQVRFPMKKEFPSVLSVCDNSSNSLPKWATQVITPVSESNVEKAKPFTPPGEVLVSENRGVKHNN